MRTPLTAAVLTSLVVLAGAVGAGVHRAEAGPELGRIVGTVSDDETGDPVSSVVVSAYDANEKLVARWPTQVDGRFQLVFLGPADVRIQFSHDEDLPYTHLDEWYHDAPTFAAAEIVHVGRSETLTVDAELERGGVISGRATNEGAGDAANAVCVYAHGAQGIWRASADGDYEVTGLASGTYGVEFADCLQNSYPRCVPPNMRYLTEWYDNAASEQDAQQVTVSTREKIGGIDAALAVNADAPSTPEPRPPPVWTITVDPPTPRVGDEVQLLAGAQGEGGVPWYTAFITPEEDSPLAIEEAPAQFLSSLGGTYVWRLRAVRPGAAMVHVGVSYEAHDCYCFKFRQCSYVFYFTYSTSPEVSVTVGMTAGDANGDGPVDAVDAALILQLNAGLVKSLPGAPDANGDGDIDSIDAALVLQLVAGLIDELPG